MKLRSCLLLVALSLSNQILAASIEDPISSPTTLEKPVRKDLVASSNDDESPKDTISRRNFQTGNKMSAGNKLSAGNVDLLEDDDSRAITTNFLSYNGLPYISILRANGYNVGFNSTQAGLVSLLGNAALALGGLFVLGKSKFLVDTSRPFQYRRPYRPKKSRKFKKRRGPILFRKKKRFFRKRPFRNHMSRHSPIVFSDGAPQKVLEPVRPMSLDDEAFDANYDDMAYEDAIVDVNNNLAQRKGPFEFDQTIKRPNFIPDYQVPERRRPQIMVKPGSNGMRQFSPPAPPPRHERPPTKRLISPPPSMSSTMEDEFETYFDNEYEAGAGQPTTTTTTAKPNFVAKYSDIDSSISLSPDGKRLRRKTRRTTTTTSAPTTTTPSQTSTPPPTTTYRPLPPIFDSASTPRGEKPELIPGFFPAIKPFNPEGNNSNQKKGGKNNNDKDEFDGYWSNDFNGASFMDDFGPPGFGSFESKEKGSADGGVKRLMIEEKLPQQQQGPIEPPRVQRKKFQAASRQQPGRPGAAASRPYDPFEDMAKEFDVNNDELIANISKAFDDFSDFKKVEN